MKKKYLIAIIILLIGSGLTLATYFATHIYQRNSVALITDHQIKDTFVQRDKDVYGNIDQTRRQTLHLTILSGPQRGKKYVTSNVYYPSQLVSQKYRPRQRIFVDIKKNQPAIVNPKRDWVLVLVLTLTLALLVAVTGRKAIPLICSLILSWVIFYGVILADVKLNGTSMFLLFASANIIFSFVSLAIVQGVNQKMLVTWVATLLGVFISFGICYAVMKLTGETEMRYETGDYATQDPRGIFMAQALLGILGAVMDEATDIVSSLHELVKTTPEITPLTLIKSGRAMGQEIMGPLINVLVLIFISGALPETILYLRDNNTLSAAFGFTLSLGATQSVIAAIGIVLTVIFATGCSLWFLRTRKQGDLV